MKRIFISTLVIVIALALSMTTACGNRDEEPEPMRTMLLPGDMTEEEFDAELEGVEVQVDDHDYAWWFMSRYWKLWSSFEETIDVGKYLAKPGIWITYQFDINASSAGDFDIDPTTRGDYFLSFDMKMIGNSDEAVANYIENYYGIEGDATGLGVGFEFDAHWESPPDSLSVVQAIGPGWPGVIKTPKGARVQPPAGTGLLYEIMDIELEGYSSQAFLGTMFGEGHTTGALYVLIDHDPTGVSDDYDNHQVVDVYFCLHNGRGPGKDLWFQSEGLLSVDDTR